ncbi:MAG: energy transducer TonB [Acidobacteriota bacterium]|nr:energy transducer TonB [Acidobacteriota bacterium]
MIAAISLMVLLVMPVVDSSFTATSPAVIAPFEDEELNQARQAYAKSNYQLAVTILQAYIEKKPKSAEAHYLLGISYRGAKQLPEATAALEKAVQLKSNLALAQFELGQVYLEVKNYEGAVRQFRWLEKNDKQMANEFQLSLPADVAKQYQVATTLLDRQRADLDAAQPVFPSEPSLRPENIRWVRLMSTEKARAEKISGIVVLKVVYSKQGKVLVSGVARGLPYGLTESAIENAQKVSFKPAMKNGEPVSVMGTMAFTFSVD